MDDVNQMPTAVQSSQPVAPAAPVVSAASSNAGFLPRFLAFLIDGILLSLVLGLFGMTSVSDGTYSMNGPGSIIGMAYMTFMVYKFGWTVGKKVMGLRVQDKETGANLTLTNALLREVLGKFLSTLAFGLGYFWMLWDKDKQTWHDKLGKSVVVKQ